MALNALNGFLRISIRAPAKGATFSGKAGVTAGSIFRFAHRALV